MVEPGEPQFVQEDTDGALALAEEERDTCPSCGMLKSWCRDPKNQFAFEPHKELCFPTQRLAEHRESPTWDEMPESTKQALQLSARFRPGHQPDLTAGLDLGDGPDGEERADERGHRPEDQ